MILVIDNNTRFLKSVSALLNKYSCHYIVKNIKTVSMAQIRKSDAIVMTGGPSISNTPKKILKKQLNIINKTRQTKKPFFGICLGMQLLCLLYGSPVIRLNKKRKGFMVIKVKKQNDILKGYKKLRVYENHMHCIRRVSKQLEILAASRDGIEAVKVLKKPVYGVEFHPEKRRTNKGYICFENFLKVIKVKR